MRRLPFALILWIALPLWAETPLPFGIRLLAPPETERGATRQMLAPIAFEDRDLEAAQTQLMQMEQRLGPYHPDLAGAITLVAEQAAVEGEIALSAELYERALHNARVNGGLYGDTQVPILRSLLGLYLESGDRDAFESRAAYQFRLMGSGLPPYDASELAAATEFFDVTLDTLIELPWEDRGRELLNFHDRVEDLTQGVCADDQVREGWCSQLTYRLLSFYYVLEFKLDVLVDDARFQSVFDRTDWQSLDREPRLEEMQRRLYRRGEMALERLLSQSPEDLDAQMALADWHWFYRKRQEAEALYRRIWQQDPVRMAQPAALPSMPIIKRYPALQNEVTMVTAEFSVSSTGTAKAISARASDSGDEVLWAARAIRDSVFRPPLDEQGEAVDSGPVTFEWLFVR